VLIDFVPVFLQYLLIETDIEGDPQGTSFMRYPILMCKGSDLFIRLNFSRRDVDID